jgi:hypothetical protein
MTANVQAKKIPGRDCPGAWRQDARRKVTLTLALIRVLRRLLDEWELVVRQWPASQGVNTEAEEATALEAVTRRQPMKIQQTQKT